jgi:hypothetical protein
MVQANQTSKEYAYSLAALNATPSDLLGASVDRPDHRFYPMFRGWPDRRRQSILEGGCVMVTPVTVRGRDLRALAGIVSEDRPDLPDGEGLPPSLRSCRASRL